MAINGAFDSAELRAITASPGAINEDLMSKIWDVSKVPMPFQDRIGTGTCTSNVHEWIQDKLGTAAANAYCENASQTGGSSSAPTDIGNSAQGPYGGSTAAARRRNHCQISAKGVTISYRAQAVNAPGGINGLAYQLMMRQRELKQDMEFILMSNTASLVGNATSTAPLLGGYLSWVASLSSPTQVLGVTAAASTSTLGGYSGSTGLTVACGSGATPGNLAETDLRDCVQAIWTGGAEPSVAIMNAYQKRAISQYMYTSSARIAQLVSEVGQGTSGADVARGAVSIMVTDYGVLEFVASRFMPKQASTTHDFIAIFDPAYLSVDYLTGITVKDQPIAGLQDQRLMYADYTLKVGSEQAVGAVIDISPTSVMTAT